MTRAVLSLGSNLGDRLAHLRSAVSAFGDSVLLVSGVYETPPWGDAEQPAYLNAVLLAEDPAATPYDWLERARAAERAAGRTCGRSCCGRGSTSSRTGGCPGTAG